MKYVLLIFLLAFQVGYAAPIYDYMSCALNCENPDYQIWDCTESYCKLEDMSAYEKLSEKEQCAFDCIWEYRRCKYGVRSEGSQYYDVPGAAYRSEMESSCGPLYMDCMSKNEIQADYSELDDYCRDKEAKCYESLNEKYCKPVQEKCVSDCGAAAPSPAQPAEKRFCYGQREYLEYCNLYCKGKLGDECAAVVAVEWSEGIVDCSCNCPSGGETFSKIDCRSPPPAQQQDKCKSVECPDKCENGVMNTLGACNPDNGECTYRQEQCPLGCENSQQCKSPVINGEVFYYDTNGKKVPLKLVQVEIISVKDSRNLAYGYLSTDAQGKFTWDDPKAFQPGSHLDITIKFNESAGRLFLVESYPDFQLAYTYDDNVGVTNPQLPNYQIDLTSHKVAGMPGAAKVYVTVQKAVDYKENVLGIRQTAPERVYVNHPKGNRHWAESSATAGNRAGMYLLPESSKLASPYVEDTIYHEYCHHIQDEIYNGQLSLSGEDHGGYYTNPDTGFGLLEGWAEYCAWEMKNYYKDNPDYDLYRIRGVAFDLEPNYQIREKVFRETNEYSDPSIMEEMAIASLLVDLRDSPQSRGGIDDDFIVVPIQTLWDAYKGKRDFGDGRGVRNVETLHDLYVALNASGYAPLYEYYDKDTRLTQLDKVFVMHGAYQDVNANGRWDMGEPIGYSGNGAGASSLRPDLEALNGSGVELDLRDQDGNRITAGAVIRVEVEFSGENSHLSYSYDVPLSDGAVYVPYPPREYGATIRMYAYVPATGKRAPAEFTITTQEFYDKVDGSKPIGKYSAELEMPPAYPCTQHYECVYAGTGNSCVSGACSQEYPQPGGLPAQAEGCMRDSDCGGGYLCSQGTCVREEPSPECCGTAAIIGLVLGIAAYSSRTR
ncbi:MAG: hypothetical protein N3H30_00760 [Candidatus Micrarchaeota archaeon]|nr:hypothetical protein [Candidatus Micrarchaeota archaeon]